MKKIFSVTIILIILVLAIVNIRISYIDNTTLLISLSNIEALASENYYEKKANKPQTCERYVQVDAFTYKKEMGIQNFCENSPNAEGCVPSDCVFK